MTSTKIQPHIIEVRCGADVAIAPTFRNEIIGANMVGWQFQFVMGLTCGTILVDETHPLVVNNLTPDIGEAFVELPSAITKQLTPGKKQNYLFRLIDTFGKSDIYLHGPIDAYVIAGARS
jgi:hypothetical protein